MRPFTWHHHHANVTFPALSPLSMLLLSTVDGVRSVRDILRLVGESLVEVCGVPQVCEMEVDDGGGAEGGRASSGSRSKKELVQELEWHLLCASCRDFLPLYISAQSVQHARTAPPPCYDESSSSSSSASSFSPSPSSRRQEEDEGEAFLWLLASFASAYDVLHSMDRMFLSAFPLSESSLMVVNNFYDHATKVESEVNLFNYFTLRECPPSH